MSTKKQLLTHLKESVLKTPRITKAFESVDRADFVPIEQRKYAYIDEPLHISSGQTISQPWTVAFMTEALEPKAGQKILEVGTGSGYQAAILSKIIGPKGKIITMEIIKELFQYSTPRLRKYKNVRTIFGDGSIGYKPEAPYDGIIVTASAPGVPKPLLEQLKRDGILVIPVGQTMIRVKNGKFENLGEFMFVPLKGKYGHGMQLIIES